MDHTVEVPIERPLESPQRGGESKSLTDVSVIPEREWDKLLGLIKDGFVIPVIGPELLCVPWQGNPAAQLYDIWGAALADCRKLSLVPDEEGTPLLYRVASRASMVPNIPQGDLEYDIDSIIRGGHWPIPESLSLLAQIRDFPLYITTTIDHLLKTALEKERGAEKPIQVAFNCGGNQATTDLPEDFAPCKGGVVFHLFGATSKDTQGFAATEDELIEFSWSLIDHNYAPKRLFDFLRSKTILLIGCDFPDWLARFFIHALTRRSDAQVAVTFVSACPDCGLRDFLERRKARLLPPIAPTAFVAELHRRWKLQQGEEAHEAPQPAEFPIPAAAKKGSVFISYCREDRKAADSIRTQLDAAGIDCWMDETGLEPGVAYREVIHTSIENASFFIAVISRALNLADSDRQRRFVFREWNWAIDVSADCPPNVSFLLPVAIDDTPSDAPFIDRNFRKAQWTTLANGKLPPNFIKFLKDGIRSYRSTPGGMKP